MRKRDREFIREVMHEQRPLSDRRANQTLREMAEARAALFAILDKLSNGGAAAAG